MMRKFIEMITESQDKDDMPNIAYLCLSVNQDSNEYGMARKSKSYSFSGIFCSNPMDKEDLQDMKSEDFDKIRIIKNKFHIYELLKMTESDGWVDGEVVSLDTKMAK